MKSISTIEFRDCDSQDDALIVIRAASRCIALGISLKSDGDLEVIIPVEKAQSLIDSLQQAISIAESQV